MLSPQRYVFSILERLTNNDYLLIFYQKRKEITI